MIKSLFKIQKNWQTFFIATNKLRFKTNSDKIVTWIK